MWRAAILCCVAGPVLADSVVTTRPIAAASTITAEDITLVGMEIPGALQALAAAIGQTARVDLAAGRPLLLDNLDQTPTLPRNTVLPLVVQTAGMEIRTEGRSLSEGRVGQPIEIMNLTSRARVTGILRADGSVLVSTTQ